LFTCVERKVAPEKARLALANNKFDTWELLQQSVCGPHMIDVHVREYNAADRRVQTSRYIADTQSGSGKASINESQPIVFPNQETIDHAETRQTEQVFCFLNKLHADPREIQ